jgi:hypothetical protein
MFFSAVEKKAAPSCKSGTGAYVGTKVHLKQYECTDEIKSSMVI